MNLTAEQWGAYLTGRLSTRTIAQGAETNLGLTVYRGRRKIDDDMMPCAVLVEGADTSKEQAGRTTRVKLEVPFALHAYVPCDPDNPNLAGHAAARDLKRAVFAGDPLLARLVTYNGRDVAPRVDGKAFVLVAIDISVEVVEDLATP